MSTTHTQYPRSELSNNRMKDILVLPIISRVWRLFARNLRLFAALKSLSVNSRLSEAVKMRMRLRPILCRVVNTLANCCRLGKVRGRVYLVSCVTACSSRLYFSNHCLSVCLACTVNATHGGKGKSNMVPQLSHLLFVPKLT